MEPRIRINPGLRLGSAFVFVLLLSLSGSPSFVAISAAVLLALLSLHKAEQILGVLSVSLPAAALTFVILVPAAILGSPSSAVLIAVKVFLSVTAVRLATAALGAASVAGALKVFFVPDIFVLVLDVTLRYVAMLGELSLAMLHALKLRSVGRNAGKAASLSGIAGTLFLRSREMAEDMYAAMECRCFTGDYRRVRYYRFHPADIIPVVVDILLLGAFFLVAP